jgi:hypothetical protein
MVHIVQLISQFATGILLITGSLSKLLNFRWFTGVLKKYEIIPGGFVRIVAFAVTLLELVIGVSLFRSRWLPWPAYAAGGLFLTFTFIICVSLARGKFHIECGCGSFWKKTMIGWHLVSRNLGLTGLALLSPAAHADGVQRIYPWLFILSLALICLPLIPRRTCTENEVTLLGQPS